MYSYHPLSFNCFHCNEFFDATQWEKHKQIHLKPVPDFSYENTLFPTNILLPANTHTLSKIQHGQPCSNKPYNVTKNKRADDHPLLSNSEWPSTHTQAEPSVHCPEYLSEELSWPSTYTQAEPKVHCPKYLSEELSKYRAFLLGPIAPGAKNNYVTPFDFEDPQTNNEPRNIEKLPDSVHSFVPNFVPDSDTKSIPQKERKVMAIHDMIT